MRKGILRLAHGWLSLLCLLAALCISFPAMAIDRIVPQRTSLTVSYRPGGVDGNGAVMRLYRIADMTGFGTFIPAGRFSGLTYPLNGQNSDDWDELAQRIKNDADERGILPSAIQTVTNGKAVFSNLDCGLYLLTADIYTRGSTLYVCRPALVSLPNHSNPDDPDAWVYDVTVHPKPGEVAADTIKVRKLWKNTAVGEALPSVQVSLLIGGKVRETVTLSRQNSWQSMFETPLRSGDNWSVTEVNVPSGFTASWDWESDGRNIWVNVTNTKKDPTPKTEEVLPQTGQLWWPVPVLALGGMALFGLGWARRRRS